MVNASAGPGGPLLVGVATPGVAEPFRFLIGAKALRVDAASRLGEAGRLQRPQGCLDADSRKLDNGAARKLGCAQTLVPLADSERGTGPASSDGTCPPFAGPAPGFPGPAGSLVSQSLRDDLRRSAHRRRIVFAGAGSPVAGSLTLVPPLRRSSMITAPAAVRAARDVR